MRHLRAVVAASAMIWTTTAAAAEVTRIASSFEKDKPFAMFVDVGLERTQTRSLITRETTRDGGNGPVTEERPELFYTEYDTRLAFAAHVGIYKDLELRFGVPLVFQRDEHWRYAGGVNAGNSTVTGNCLSANGAVDPACAAGGAGSQPLFGMPFETFRGGVGNLEFGLRHRIFNQAEDPSKPDWIVAFDYTAPTAELLNPSIPATADDRGAFGDRNHRYAISTALSRRMGIADPYFTAKYSFPFRGPGWYSNCDQPSGDRMAAPDNCGTEAWGREETGIKAPRTLGLSFGTELNLPADLRVQQRFVIDLKGLVNYVGPGRYYNALSGPLGKLLATEDYLQFGGSLAVIAQPADFVRLHARATLAHNTGYGLTAESLGKDLDGNGSVDTSVGSPELNPNFDYRLDMASRRFRATENSVFTLNLMLDFIF